MEEDIVKLHMSENGNTLPRGDPVANGMAWPFPPCLDLILTFIQNHVSICLLKRTMVAVTVPESDLFQMLRAGAMLRCNRVGYP